jgi:hypothetical protein
MEPAVVYPKPAFLRGIEDIGVTLAKANVGMIVGFSGVHDLGRDNVIS